MHETDIDCCQTLWGSKNVHDGLPFFQQNWAWIKFAIVARYLESSAEHPVSKQ